MSGGAASAGGVLFPPCMRHRRSACTTSRSEAPRAPSVAFLHRAGQRAAFRRCIGDAPCVCFNGRENRGRGRPVSAAHAALPGLSSLSFVGVRIKWPAGRGGMAVKPGKPHRDCCDFGSMSTGTMASAIFGIRGERAIFGDLRRSKGSFSPSPSPHPPERVRRAGGA
jgi:hypothetical protein